MLQILVIPLIIIVFGLHPIYLTEQIITCIFVNELKTEFKISILAMLLAETIVIEIGGMVKFTGMYIGGVIMNCILNIVQIILGYYAYHDNQVSSGLFITFVIFQILETVWRIGSAIIIVKKKSYFTESNKVGFFGVAFQVLTGALFLASNIANVKVYSDLATDIAFVCLLQIIQTVYNATSGIFCGIPLSFLVKYLRKEDPEEEDGISRIVGFSLCTCLFFATLALAAGITGLATGTQTEQGFFWANILILVMLTFMSCCFCCFFYGCRDKKSKNKNET